MGEIVLLVVGVVWTIAGAVLVTYSVVFRYGIWGQGGGGWGGVALASAVALLGPALIAWAVW